MENNWATVKGTSNMLFSVLAELLVLLCSSSPFIELATLLMVIAVLIQLLQGTL